MMMAWAINVGAMVVSLAAASSACAQTSLLWKFEKGQVYEAERVATQKQTVEFKSKSFKQQQHSAWQVRLEVKGKQADVFVVMATLTKVEHTLTGAAEAEMVDPKLHEKMRGSTFTLDVAPDGRIVKLQGYEEFLARVAGMDKASVKSLRATFPESALKEAFADLFGPLPEKGVKSGDGWQSEYVEPIPHFGSLRVKAMYKYEGTVKARDRVSYALQTKYEVVKDERMVLFQIVKGRIDRENASGFITFDRAAGHLVEHERTMQLHGALTIDAMGRQQILEFSSTSGVKIRVKRSNESK